MNAKDLLRFNIEFTHNITKRYLEDFSDDELLVRPVPGTNHLAWQLGHLVVSEHAMVTSVGGKVPALPDGFAETHSKEACSSDDPAQFMSKAEYLGLLDQMHQAALTTLETISEDQLDQPAPEMFRNYLPTVGAVLHMAGAHEMMHVGQFVAVRRKLRKPVVI